MLVFHSPFSILHSPFSVPDPLPNNVDVDAPLGRWANDPEEMQEERKKRQTPSLKTTASGVLANMLRNSVLERPYAHPISPRLPLLSAWFSVGYKNMSQKKEEEEEEKSKSEHYRRLARKSARALRFRSSLAVLRLLSRRSSASSSRRPINSARRSSSSSSPMPASMSEEPSDA